MDEISWPQQDPIAPGAPETATVPGTRRRRRGRLIIAGCALAVLGCGSGIAIGVGVGDGRTTAGHGSRAASGDVAVEGTVLPRFSYPDRGPLGSGSTGESGSGSGTSSGSGTGDRTTATTAQQVGVVDINTVLNYGQGEAAGTGTLMSSDGEILTNNHVIDDATKITVTVVSTGRSYPATVVGTDPSDDIAVLQLANASGLATANYGDSDSVEVGDSVTGVGNAGGVGGTPSAATGTVTALDQQITASDADGTDAQTLTGLIETDAGIQAGDSGGPLYDASGEIIGVDTAAQTTRGAPGSPSSAQTVAAYAITIDHALRIAEQIESATESTETIHVGYPAFLGVATTATDGQGAGVVQVLANTPAAAAGLVAGDVITAVGGARVTTPGQLAAALATYRPGDRVAISWTDSYRSAHKTQVTLVKGPAD